MFSDIDKSWAVHLAIVPDCSATSFVKSLKRFIARKGTQNLFLSDNGTQFKNDEMKHSQELIKLILNGDTSFMEACSWWGWRGFWERLVQTVKRTLTKNIRQSNSKFWRPNNHYCNRRNDKLRTTRIPVYWWRPRKFYTLAPSVW